MKTLYSKLSLTIMLVMGLIGSSFFVFGDIKSDAKNEGYHQTLYTDSFESADASSNAVEVLDTFRVVDDDNPIDFFDVGVSGGTLSVQESGSNAVLTLSDTKVMVNGSDGLCFGSRCASTWPDCNSTQAIGWDQSGSDLECRDIGDAGEISLSWKEDRVALWTNDDEVGYDNGVKFNSSTNELTLSSSGDRVSVEQDQDQMKLNANSVNVTGKRLHVPIVNNLSQDFADGTIVYATESAINNGDDQDLKDYLQLMEDSYEDANNTVDGLLLYE